MLTRRHIRIKVMQTLYALKTDPEMEKSSLRRFLNKSMDDMYDLFLLYLSLLVQLQNHAEDFIQLSKNKFLATQEDKNPNKKFVNNALIKKIADSAELNAVLEKKGLSDWQKEPQYEQLLWKEIRESDSYKKYISTHTSSFKEDKNFVATLFKTIIAPNEKLHDYFEDKKLTWMDDLAIVNTAVLNYLKKIQANRGIALPELYKSMDDRDFAFELLEKTHNYNYDFEEEISKRTPNWDQERLAEIDSILIKMALCEFQYFPSIPVKVSINEYLEIAKEYSTPKSSLFINGVLDRVSKSYLEEGKINKTGRGLL